MKDHLDERPPLFQGLFFFFLLRPFSSYQSKPMNPWPRTTPLLRSLSLDFEGDLRREGFHCRSSSSGSSSCRSKHDTHHHQQQRQRVINSKQQQVTSCKQLGKWQAASSGSSSRSKHDTHYHQQQRQRVINSKQLGKWQAASSGSSSRGSHLVVALAVLQQYQQQQNAMVLAEALQLSAWGCAWNTIC